MNMIEPNNLDDWRKWVLENHPSVKNLKPGYATICVSPYGFLWFGESNGLLEIGRCWLIQKEVEHIGLWENGWPHQLRMGEFLVEFQCVADDYGIYKLVRTDNVERSMFENQKFLEILKINHL